jgi:hypothetical protein
MAGVDGAEDEADGDVEMVGVNDAESGADGEREVSDNEDGEGDEVLIEPSKNPKRVLRGKPSIPEAHATSSKRKSTPGNKRRAIRAGREAGEEMDGGARPPTETIQEMQRLYLQFLVSLYFRTPFM